MSLARSDPEEGFEKASAHRQLGDNVSDMRDIEKALALEKLHPEGLLERSILRRLQNNDSGERLDWLVMIELAPASDASKSAQANLEKMDGSG